MLGINKRLDKIEYRLARIDKMLEDILTYAKGKKPPPTIEDAFIKQFESQIRQEYNRLKKEHQSVVIHKPIANKPKPKTNRYPASIIKAMSGRYQTVDKIAERIGSTELSVHTYLKIMRKDGVKILTRGRAPTEYKLAKGAINNG